MAKRTNPATVGIFVLGGLVLTIALILALGAGKWFSERNDFVCFFGGDLNGLKVGAPVKFRGVPIGSVTGIRINLPGRNLPRPVTAAEAEEFRLPVLIELEEERVTALGARGGTLTRERMQQFIEAGLRARLATESLLTGLLYVELNFFPGTPAEVVLQASDRDYMEIPTLPTQFEQIQEAAMRGLGKLDSIDFKGLVNAMTAAANSAHEFVSSQDLKQAVVELGDAAGSLRKTSDATRETLVKFRDEFGPLSESLRKTSNQADLTMQGAQRTMVDLQQVLDPDSPLMYQLARAADRLGDASAALGNLAGELDRNPSMIVRGRATPNQKQ